MKTPAYITIRSFLLSIPFLTGCAKDISSPPLDLSSSFSEIASLHLGSVGTAGATAFDTTTQNLFVTSNKEGIPSIDIVDLTNPLSPSLKRSIDLSAYGVSVKSVAVSGGILAAAIEDQIKTRPGKVVLLNSSNYQVLKQLTVGALPVMVAFSPDGKYLLSANEGKPNEAYTIDPRGTVSIISVDNDFSVATIDFSSFIPQEEALKSKGFVILGPDASLVQDIQPRYISYSSDSRTAWVTLQQNNAIAKIDIYSSTITSVMPLGFKNFSLAENAIDPSDRDNSIKLGKWPVKGIYQPDGIAVYEKNGTPYLFTANEGGRWESDSDPGFKRVNEFILDSKIFPDRATLYKDAILGRLKICEILGDTDKDNNIDQLYAFGARSFSVWNGNSGVQVYDSKNELEANAIKLKKYDDDYSDDKGVEPESITLGLVENKMIAFVGLARANLMAIYDVTEPFNPVFLKMLRTGDSPQGITFIPAQHSPNGKSIVVVGSQTEALIKIYSAD